MIFDSCPALLRKERERNAREAALSKVHDVSPIAVR